jgi:hypothetical protein
LEIENWQLQDLKCQPSSLFSIGKIFAGVGIEPRSALPIMSLMHLLQSSIDADMKIR